MRERAAIAPAGTLGAVAFAVEWFMSPTLRRVAWCVLPILGPLAGCAATADHAARTAAVNAQQPAIELLGFPGCPNTPAMRENLSAALASIGRGWTFTDINQEELPEGDLRRGWPSPTILVNGRDLFGMPVPTAPGMGCRFYPGAVPGANEIGEKLKDAAGN